ncbi:L-piperidine-6-carboxylate dehydrogenase [Peijinzhouia sedimentorum]
MQDRSFKIQESLALLGIQPTNEGISTGSKSWKGRGIQFDSYSPVDGSLIGSCNGGNEEDFNQILEEAQKAFEYWRMVPAPQRGEIVRQIGDELRKYKDPLGRLVSYEMGKSLQEGWGEVQEMIDICDFATGLSRQLHGFTMHSERPSHRMYDQYHPLGVVGIISAFNFPVAVWSWNSMLAWICGDVCIWKPSEKSFLSAIACQNIAREVFKRNSLPEGISNLIVGDYKVGELMSNSPAIPLVSATGSTRMGKLVSEAVGKRLGKTILELGGNNAMIITPSADLNIAIPGAVFGAVGTCGQRCTSTRRLIVHESMLESVKEKLKSAYSQLKIGNPLDEKIHVGPLIDKDAVKSYQEAIQTLDGKNAEVVVAGGILEGEGHESGCFVKPAIYCAKPEWEIVQKETFAPILYILTYRFFDEAISIQNSVPQGLSSSLMSLNLREAEQFLSHKGSDCGIANVNIGTSGAEIGGAFGGEKETGGGRESGSDAWKAYMRRQTNTINYGNTLPLAQGIKFDL